ncbi:MAG: DEAD/DEAH box helicase family protein, partial [Deltaproteobacteria bacterium]|nr:DEAD/DEAH box helicase family protein [Deltaproteobacteria bacterium]
RFFPYQFKPVLKFLENPSQRVLIADDVGLGKTIEAGYILREWRARQALQNILIVVPARLRTKWKHELSRRFGEDFEVVRAKEIRNVLRRLEKGGDLEEFRWITSYESVRDEDLIDLFSDLRPGIDLLIMDEAHRARNRGTLQYRAARALSQCADAIVLLTATPVQTGLDNLYTLIDLLEPDRYSTYSEFQEILEANRPIVRASQCVGRGLLREAGKELASLREHPLTENLLKEPHFQALLERLWSGSPAERDELVRLQRDVGDFSLLGHLLSRTRKVEVMENWPIRDPQPQLITLSEDEKAIYEAARQITWLLAGPGSGWGQTMAALMAFRYTASCIPAAAAYVRERLKGEGLSPSRAEMAAEVDMEVLDEEGIEFAGATKLLKELVDKIHLILSRCPSPAQDSKFQAFRAALLGVWADDDAAGRARRKVVVFSFFKRTLGYLEEQLRELGVTTRLIHGDVGFDDREVRIEEFLESPDIRVLLSSEVGGEGIDLQKASVIVNYDLPWNPMVVEQRIGRIDRIGQEANRLVIVNLVCQDTVEERILYRLYDRIGLFRESIGEIDEILGPMDVQRLMREALRGDLSREELDTQFERTAQASERKKEQAGRLAQEADGLLAADQAFLDEVHHLVRRRRLPDPADLRELVLGTLESRYSGISLAEDGSKHPGLLRLGTSAVREFQEWSRRSGTDGYRIAMQLQSGSLPVTFDADVAMEHPRCEFIQAQHPLVQFAVHVGGQVGSGQPMAYVLQLESSELPAGHWVFAVWGVELTAWRTEHRLETVACRAEDGQILAGEDADALLVAALAGTAEPEAMPALPREVIAACSQSIRASFEQRFGEIVRGARQAEERRAARLRATWEQTLTARRNAARARLAELKGQKAKEFSIRMAEASLAKREAALKAKLEEFREPPRLRPSHREILAGLAIVKEGSS